MYQIYTKIYIYKLFYKNLRFKQIIFSKYATNLKTTISHRSLNNLGLLLLLLEFNNFSFLIHIIDNIIITSGSCDQSFHQNCTIRYTPFYFSLNSPFKSLHKTNLNIFFKSIKMNFTNIEDFVMSQILDISDELVI